MEVNEMSVKQQTEAPDHRLCLPGSDLASLFYPLGDFLCNRTDRLVYLQQSFKNCPLLLEYGVRSKHLPPRWCHRI